MEETRERNEWKKKMLGREMTDEEKLLPEEVYLRSTLETNEGHSRGWAGQYGIEMNHDIEALKKLKKAYEFYQKLEKDIPEDEKWKIMREERIVNTELVPPDVKNPTEILKKQIEQAERRILFSRQASDSQLMQAEDSHETQQYLISAHKYAIREATKAYAEAGIYAMDNTIDPKKPVAITMENIFPERFGGHPDELKILINEARKEMVERLSHKYIRDPANKREKDPVTHEITGEIIKVPNPYYRGIPEEQARKEANEHIKATLDTGHLNTWRKYWQTDPKKSIEENNNEFNKWILKQVEDLARNNMIGNVHLTDNYGYQDDHLAPGQGNAPIKDVLKILKKHGYSGPLTVEPGSVAPSALPQQNWSDVQYSYFGRSYPPYFIFGDFAPSRDWTLWSQVPVE